MPISLVVIDVVVLVALEYQAGQDGVGVEFVPASILNAISIIFGLVFLDYGWTGPAQELQGPPIGDGFSVGLTETS